MVIDYTTIAANAQSAIEDAGLAVTVTRKTVDSFDPDLGTTIPGADIVATGTGVMTRYSNYNIDGTVIKQGDQRLLIGPTIAIEPAQNDIVTVDGADWNIVNVEQVSPGGTDCLYKCQIRK